MRIYCNHCKAVFEAEKKDGVTEAECPKCKAKMPFPASHTSPGAVIGDFLIEREISRGGMGEVYLARQLSLDRPVALKVLQDKFLNDREYVESLFREARAAAKINHPNIVQAYAVGEENGTFYFAMEFVRGETLKQILKREKRLEFTKAAKIIRDVAGALDVAWREQKLVHQDIKPDNIMLDVNGFAKLADLGLAKTGADREQDIGDEVMGTPQYISPEQLTGVPTDVRSDIYSLGATFYQFVTGRFPYVADTGDEIARMHVEGKLQPPKEVNPELPDELNAIIMKMMARDINERYQTPEPLMKALDIFLRQNRSATAPAVPKLNLKLGAGGAPALTLPKAGAPAAKTTAPKPAATGGSNGVFLRPPKKGKNPAAATPAAVPAAKPVTAKPVVAQPSLPAAPKAATAPAATPATPIAKPLGKATLGGGVKPAVPASPVKPKAPVQSDVSPKPLDDNKKTEPSVKNDGKVTEEIKPVERPKPAAPAEEKSAESNAKETSKGKKEKPSKSKKIKVDGEAPAWHAKVIRGIVLAVILIVVAIGGLVGVYFLTTSGKMPEFGKSYGEKLVDWVDEKIDEFKKTPEKSGVPAQGTQPKPKPVAPPIVTREAYLAESARILNEARTTPGNTAVLLQNCDAFFVKFPKPQTPAEEAALAPLLSLYGKLDETVRMAPARAEAKAAREAETARRVADRDARQAAEEQARQAAEAAKLAEQQAAEARIAEAARMAEQQKEEDAKRTEVILKDLAVFIQPIRDGILQYGKTGDKQPLEAALADAATYRKPLGVLTPGEQKALDEFNSLRNSALDDAEELRKLIVLVRALKESDGFSVETADGRLVNVVRISNDGTIWVRSEGKLEQLDLSNPQVAKRFFLRMERRFKLKNAQSNFLLSFPEKRK